jgi:hypothetical protein
LRYNGLKRERGGGRDRQPANDQQRRVKDFQHAISPPTCNVTAGKKALTAYNCHMNPGVIINIADRSALRTSKADP